MVSCVHEFFYLVKLFITPNQYSHLAWTVSEEAKSKSQLLTLFLHSIEVEQDTLWFQLSDYSKCLIRSLFTYLPILALFYFLAFWCFSSGCYLK